MFSKRALARWGVVVLVFFPLMGLPRSAQPLKMDTIALKVAMIGKIAEFVQWPASVGLDDPARPLEFVILGSSALESRLMDYYRQVRIAGHRVFLRRAHDIDDIGRPQILFVAPSAEDDIERITARLNRVPTLIVADSPGFAKRGVAINMFIDGDQVGFEVSRAALQRHKLQASYHLLNLARLIETQQARR